MEAEIFMDTICSLYISEQPESESRMLLAYLIRYAVTYLFLKFIYLYVCTELKKDLWNLKKYKWLLADSGLIFHLKMNIWATAPDILIQSDNYSGEQ